MRFKESIIPIMWVGLILWVILLVISSAILSIMIDKVCSIECGENNALGSDVIHKGVGKQDICVCYYPNSIQAFEVKQNG